MMPGTAVSRMAALAAFVLLFAPLPCRGEEDDALLVTGKRDFGFTDGQTPLCGGTYARSFNVDGAFVMDLAISDTGRGGSFREHCLRAAVTGRDGGLRQEFAYDSDVLPWEEEMGGCAWLEDMNLDGAPDLMLCTARGASNEYCVCCPWDPSAGQFGPMLTAARFDPDTGGFGENAPLELADYALILCRPAQDADPYLIVRSLERDGYAEYTVTAWMWNAGGIYLEMVYVFDVYEAGDGMIGERMYEMFSQSVKCWDQQYPEAWYFGGGGVSEARLQAAGEMIGGKRVYRSVANADWVHLREMDSKASASLARLDAGTEVRVLREDDSGWTLVLWDSGEGGEDGSFGTVTMTGYIWHSFLADGSAERMKGRGVKQ